MNILEDLEEKRVASRVRRDNKSDSENTQLLLASGSQEERELMRNLGMDQHIREAESVIGNDILLAEAESEWGTIYTTYDIKDLCLDYDIKFLNIEHFSGNISTELPSVILQFCKDNNITYTNSYLADDFFIAAPKRSFKPSKKPIDPILFYRVSTEGERKYVIVHKWGKNFTKFRLIKGLINRNIGTFSAARSVLFSSAALLLAGMCGIPGWGSLLIVPVVATITTLICVNDDTVGRNISEENWNYHKS